MKKSWPLGIPKVSAPSKTLWKCDELVLGLLRWILCSQTSLETSLPVFEYFSKPQHCEILLNRRISGTVKLWGNRTPSWTAWILKPLRDENPYFFEEHVCSGNTQSVWTKATHTMLRLIMARVTIHAAIVLTARDISIHRKSSLQDNGARFRPLCVSYWPDRSIVVGVPCVNRGVPFWDG